MKFPQKKTKNRIKMTTTEIIQQLCIYDNRNPNFEEYNERINKHKECYCDNCFRGKDKLANELLRVKEELKECKEVLFTDYEE